MAISASSVTPSNSLEEFRIEFNNLVTDVTGITSTNTFSTAIVFEGATADDYETTLTLTDPTADRTITLPNITGTVLVGTQANPDSADGTALGSASLEWSDLFLADGGQILFGNDQEITLSHNADNGLILKHVGTSDGIEPSLTFQAGDTDIAINDVLGSIFFQAPDEGSGTDAILIAAGIEAVSEGDFSASNNATKLSFLTAASELASEKMSLSSGGNLALPTDGTVLSFGADSDVTLTHAADTSLTLNLMMAATTFEPSGDTASGDNAAIGYTAAEGLILTGQGSTSDITFKNDADTTVFTIPTGTDDILFPDNAKAMFGAGSDLQLFHDGTNSYIKDAGTGNITVQANQVNFINAAGNETLLQVNEDGAVIILHDNSQKFTTDSAGVDITGTLDLSSHLDMPDDAIIKLGTSDDLQIYHDGSQSYIRDTATGSLRLTANEVLINNADDDEAIAKFIEDGAVELYYDNTKQLETVSGGGTLTGSWAVTTSLNPDASDGATLGTTALEWSDLYLADGAVIGFGDDQDVTLTHSHDAGLDLKRANTADDSYAVLTLQTGDTDIAVDDILGALQFQAPDEGAGTDAILVAAAILAQSEGDFSSSNNATKLSFRTGASEAATEKMSLSSGGNLTLPSDAVVLNFGADSDVNLTHVADTGLLLNSTRQLQFNDASQYISGASATKMDIRATDEIELTSTLVDVVGALTVSGTTTLNGALVLGDAAADTLTVNATLQGASPLTFEGGTADGHETTFAITDPTADRTITFPNKSMTVAGLDDVTALAIALG